MGLSKQSLVLTLCVGVGAAGLGAGTEKFFAIKEKARALQQLAFQSAQKQITTVTSDAVTLADVQAYAFRDKNAALEQVEAQLPAGQDITVSVGFNNLNYSYPWLSSVRQGVGYFRCLIRNELISGTAELLDKEGTLVLSAHQYSADCKNPTISFFPTPYTVRTLPVRMIGIDQEKDVAFATLSSRNAAALVNHYHVRPIQWRTASQRETSNPQAFLVGFPLGIPRLHATSGNIVGPLSTPVVGHECKFLAAGASFPGMSGGGVFQNGEFVGVINAGTPAGTNPSAYYTPYQTIQLAYAELFPKRANKLGLSSEILAERAAGLPNNCKFGPQGSSLLTLVSR